MRLIAHLHPLSSYCQKLTIGLRELGVPFETRMPDLMDPDARAAYAALWPTAKIPLLQHGERVVPETSIQLEYAQRLAPDGARLIPAEAEAALEARLMDRLFDAYVMTPMQAFVADILRPEAERDPRALPDARATLAMSYAMLDGRLAGRTWAAGDAFTIADCAAAPALFYSGVVAPWPKTLATLDAYFERLLTRPSVRQALAEAQPFFDMYPFRDSMPDRFRRGDFGAA